MVLGCYFRLRDLFFGLAQLSHERPELHDGARSLFERIAVSTGRDHAKAMSWFDGAVARAPSYVGQKRTTIASTFYYALQAGWSRASLLDPDQDDALYRARSAGCITFSTMTITSAATPPGRRNVSPRAFAIRVCAPRLLPRWRSF